MVPCNSRRANENAWRFSHRKMFISKHLMFRSCLSEIVWFKFQIISSWRVPVWTATSQRGTFPSIALREDASISGKKSKAVRGHCEGYQCSTQLPYGSIFLKILVLPTTTIQVHGLSISEKKVWLKGTQPKYVSKLTFALSALSIRVRNCFLF